MDKAKSKIFEIFLSIFFLFFFFAVLPLPTHLRQGEVYTALFSLSSKQLRYVSTSFHIGFWAGFSSWGETVSLSRRGRERT